MICIPAPYLRGFSILMIGATFLIGHAAFAAPQSSVKAEVPIQITAVMPHDGEESLRDIQSLELAENCYLEVQKHRTPQGKIVSRIVHECD